jgi:hypothetical protein
MLDFLGQRRSVLPRSNNEVEIGGLTDARLTTSVLSLTPNRDVSTGVDFPPLRDTTSRGA